MNTDDLVRALAADGGRLRVSLPVRYAAAVGGAALLVAVAYLAWHGPRTDVAGFAWTPRIAFKLAVPLAAAIAAAGLALCLVRPGTAVRPRLLWLAAVAAALAIGVAAELAVLPPAEWLPRLVGLNAWRCLVTVPLLSVLPLAAGLVALSRGAPLSPAAAGASAGLTAGAAGALIYATVCPDDSPLFLALWYGLAVAAVTGAGALVGRRLLRW
jgi:hypothetical protein